MSGTTQPNTSNAVRQKRYEDSGSLDFFPTPPWATRALFNHVIDIAPDDVILEPACGRGDMVRPLLEKTNRIISSDVHDYGYGTVTADFLADPPPFGTEPRFDWVITNPPFNAAQAFISRSLPIVRKGVAIFVRSAFLEGTSRYKSLYSVSPPSIYAPFVERVPLFKDRLYRKGSTATAYCWIVWTKGDVSGNTFVKFIPMCRKQLERDSDYDGYDQPD